MDLKFGIGLKIGLIVVVVCADPLLLAQSKTTPASKAPVRVPFVGCKSDGQVGPVKAPIGESKFVALTPDVSNRLAYYESAQKIAVLAPRGWYCFGTYGSNGESLFVSPQEFNTTDLFSANWSGFAGSVIQITREYGDTSGRFGVADAIARVFPTHKAFVDAIIKEGIEPASSFTSGPYPADKLVYKNKEVVEYETPAQKDGLGTNSRLRKNEAPISGVAILKGQTPDLLFLAARLPPDLTDLTSAIIQQVERDAGYSGR